MQADIVDFDKKHEIAIIKKGVKIVPSYTILGNPKIKTVIVSDGVTEIEGFAFSNLRNLQFVALPSTLEKIGDFGFCACGSTKVTLPDSITNLGFGAFDFNNGSVKLNVSNLALVERVEHSLRGHIYTATCEDQTLTFSNIQYIEREHIENIWSKFIV